MQWKCLPAGSGDQVSFANNNFNRLTNNSNLRRNLYFNNPNTKINLGVNMNGPVWNCRGAKTTTTIREMKRLCRDRSSTQFFS